jgi:hypothetical protein
MPRIHGVERRATPDLNRHESRGHVGNRAARDDEACTNSATGLILLPACVGGAPGHELTDWVNSTPLRRTA